MPRNIFMLSAMVTLLPALSGCGVLVGTAAGAGAGYYVGTDERSPAQIAEDAAVTGKVKTRLGADEQVNALAIDVDTYMDTVTLSGTVPDRNTAQRAITIARSVDDVKSVRSRLQVVPDSNSRS
jgi:hyperosmotically inducible periplasmic protein